MEAIISPTSLKRKTSASMETITGKRRRRSKVDKRSFEVIKIGDTVDLSKHLFTNSRNYLLNYGYARNQKIEAKDLEGKVMILLFVSPRDSVLWHYHLPQMVDMYRNLNGRVEFIFVAHDDDTFLSYPLTRHYAELFDIFCRVPWPSIPWSDVKCRKHLQTLFAVADTSACMSFIIDHKGLVLQSQVVHRFSLKYGAAAYPFTNERIEFLEHEDDAAKKHASPTTLLASEDGQDFLINSNGDKVPLTSLKDKIVGLFFWAGHGTVWGELDKAYEELSRYNKPFEVVLIYAHQWWIDRDDEEKWFWDDFKDMPWLAIPFEHTTRSKRLQRIFKFNHEGHDEPEVPAARLVIIGPQDDDFIKTYGPNINEYGANILEEYGASAYPFYLSCAFFIEREKLNKVELQKLWDSKDVFTQENGTEVLFSELLGKRIIVVFQKNNRSRFVSMLKDLKQIYLDVKGTDDEFEVIHVQFVSAEAPMPWLCSTPFDKGSYGYELMSDLFPDYYNGLLAFDLNGLLVRKACLPAVGVQDFPFHAYVNMEIELFAELVERLQIPLDALSEDERELVERLDT